MYRMNKTQEQGKGKRGGSNSSLSVHSSQQPGEIQTEDNNEESCKCAIF